MDKRRKESAFQNKSKEYKKMQFLNRYAEKSEIIQYKYELYQNMRID